MKLKKITIENFKVFPRKTVIDLTDPNPKDKRNIFLIGGTNGSGKTSILEAIKLCLYGRKALGWSQKKLFETINNQEQRKDNYRLFFQVEFETDENDKLVVKRKWDIPASVLDPYYSDLESKLVIEKGEKIFKILDEAQWQEYLNAKIPEGVLQFFFFDGEKIKKLAEEGGGETLRSSIETILGLEILRQLVSDLDRVLYDFKREGVDVYDEEIKKVKAEIDLLEKNLEVFRQQIRELEKEIKKMKAEKEEKREEFRILFGIEPEKKEKIEGLDKKKIRLSNKKTGLEKEIRDYFQEVLPLALLARFFPKIEKQIKREEDIRKRKALQEEKEKLAQNLVLEIFKEKCPIGNEPVSEDDQGMLIRRIIDFISKRESERTGQSLLGFSADQQKEVESVISEVKRSAAQRLVPLIQEKTRIERKLGEIEKRVRSLEKKGGSEEDYERLLENLSNLDNNIGRRKQELREIENKTQEAQEDIEKTKKSLGELYDKYEKSKETRSLINITKRSKEVLESYIKELREQKISTLKKNIFSMFNKLATKSDLFSEIEIDSNNYRVDVIDKRGRKIHKRNLSAGEKEIYAISLLWGLAETSTFHLPIIIDTPLARLDKQHRENIVKKYFPNAGKQVILLSTDTEVDKEYYYDLEPYIVKAYHLRFDKAREWSTLETGYFW